MEENVAAFSVTGQPSQGAGQEEIGSKLCFKMVPGREENQLWGETGAGAFEQVRGGRARAASGEQREAMKGEPGSGAPASERQALGAGDGWGQHPGHQSKRLGGEESWIAPHWPSAGSGQQSCRDLARHLPCLFTLPFASGNNTNVLFGACVDFCFGKGGVLDMSPSELGKP